MEGLLQTSLCGYVCILHGWLYAMCLMAGYNGLPVTQNQLKEMEENGGEEEHREEWNDRTRKRTVNGIMRRKPRASNL